MLLPDENIPVSKEAEIAARCHEVQTGLGLTEVPEFDGLIAVGMAVRLALHMRGLPPLKYDTVRMVAGHYFQIPATSVKSVLDVLAEVEFVKLQTEGHTIKTVVPDIPYYETLYETLGVYADGEGFNEPEQLTLDLLRRLSKSPEKLDSLLNKVGAERKLVDRAFDIGERGAYFSIHRSRGKDIALSPAYFSENAEIFADIVAGGGAEQIQKLLIAIRSMQGVPLTIVRKNMEIAGSKLSEEEYNLLLRLAHNGTVKPPSIETEHSGKQYFLFTPTPSGASLAPTKRDIYEKAMAVVAAMRQGQFLPRKYAIHSPGAVLAALRSNMKLKKATTEASQQYQNLVHLRVARIVDVGNGYGELQIIDTPENREALDIAYDLISEGTSSGTEVDQEACEALQKEYSFIESLVASGQLKQRHPVKLTEEQNRQIENTFLR